LQNGLLVEKIKSSGYKLSYLADKLGISAPAFTRRMQGKPEFSKSEVFLLCTILNIDESERDTIFLP